MPLLDDTRATWSARPADGTIYRAAPETRIEVFLHYYGSSELALASRPHSACLALLRSIQADHLRKWNDIGYNAAVCPHGRAAEARGLDTVGAHCPDHNRSGYGVLLMLGGEEAPPMVQKARTVQLVRDLETRSGDVLRRRGHREGTATECPGDVVYGWLTAGMPVIGTKPTAPAYPRSVYLTEDGILDVGTRQALQRMWGVDDDGDWGPITWAAAARWAGLRGTWSRAQVARAIQTKLGAPIEPWSYGWTTKPTRTTRYLESYYNRAVRRHGPI